MQSRTDHRLNPGPGPGDVDPDDPLPDFKHLNIGEPDGLSVPKQMEPSEVRKLCKDRSSRIFANRDRLRRILDRHESTIQTRWSKKTKKKKLKVLLRAWPHMAPDRRPDISAFRKGSLAQVESTRKTCASRKSYL